MLVQLPTGSVILGVWLYLSEPQFCHLETWVNNGPFRNSHRGLGCQGLNPKLRHNVCPVHDSLSSLPYAVRPWGNHSASQVKLQCCTMGNDNKNACPGAVRRLKELIPTKPTGRVQ